MALLAAREVLVDPTLHDAHVLLEPHRIDACSLSLAMFPGFLTQLEIDLPVFLTALLTELDPRDP